MKNYKQLITEMPTKTVVFAFGRFQPPTTGHELLVKAVAKVAQQKRAEHVIFASKTQDKKKNPLTVDRKVHYLRKMFPRINFQAANDQVRTFIEAAKFLNKRYKNIVMIAGSDRVQAFTKLLNDYNGKEFNFDSIEVISAGQRDPDDDSAAGMSGTKMRQAAEKGNYAEFKKGLPSSMRDIDGRRLMNDIRQGMGMDAIREQVVFKKDQLREQYFRGEIFNVGDVVEDDSSVYKIVNRGSNHILVQETSGELVSKWIQDVKPTERTFMLDEGLSNKTLKTSDKIKVGRVIANMLGVENAEQLSNPTQLVNMGLRNIRKKALNAAALELIKKMCELADDMDISYDKNLLPQKLKEGTIQPNGTDKIIPASDSSVVVDKKSNRNAAKDVLRYKDFKKLMKVEEDDKETESDFDADFEDAPEHTEVGGLMNPPYSVKDDNLRRRKVNYHLGEASEMGDAAAKRAQKEKQRAQLQIKQSKEKEALRVRQERERDQLKNEEVIDEISDATKASYTDKAKKEVKQLKPFAKKGQEYSDLAKNIIKKREAGIKKANEETVNELSNDTLGSYKKKAAADASAADKAGNFKKADKRFSGIVKATKKQFDNDLKEGQLVMRKSDAISTMLKFAQDYLNKNSSNDRNLEAFAKMIGKKYSTRNGRVVLESETPEQMRQRHIVDLQELEDDIKANGAWDDTFEQAFADRWEDLLSDEALNEMAALCGYTGHTGPVVDVDDVTSSINPPHEEKYEDHFPVDSEEEKEYAHWEKEIEILDVDQDNALDALVASITDDELIDLAYDDDELEEVDEDGEVYEMDDEEKELDESLRLVEGLSRMERIKARQRLKRTAAKRKRSINISMKRISSSKTANLRARRAAIKKIKQRVLRGRNPSQLSVGEKERVEKFVASKKGLINRLAMKMIPRVRQLEKKRMANARKKR